jgi:ribose 5-phosphate isomerase B
MIVEDDDYPDFIKLAAEGVSKDPDDMAIVFGYSGEGEAMVANRYPAVRAGVYNGGSGEIVKLLREHNNANVLSVGAHFISTEQTLQVVKLFLATPFSGDARHIRRLGKF